MATQSDTFQVSGIRCERCVQRLAGVLTGHEGLEGANANLMGLVTLEWDDERTTRGLARADAESWLQWARQNAPP